jgi:hypothetical protein
MKSLFALLALGAVPAHAHPGLQPHSHGAAHAQLSWEQLLVLTAALVGAAALCLLLGFARTRRR